MTDVHPLIQRLDDAAELGTKGLLQEWKTIQSESDGPVPEAVRIHMGEVLIRLARPGKALDVLEGMDTVRATQLRALALDKRGHDGDADDALKLLLRLFRELKQRGELDAETGGLLGGRYKKRARREGDDPILLGKARDVYQETWNATGDTYPGINAAALTLEVDGDPGVARAREIAGEVIEKLEALPRSSMDHWLYATRGEAHLLHGDLGEARTWYEAAVRSDPNAVENIAVMRRQARVELRLLGLPEDALDDVLILRSVAAFTGHLGGSDGTARLPAALEGAARRAIRERLKAGNVGFGVCSGGREGDVIFLEELLERGGIATVVLPCPLDAFEPFSDGTWTARMRTILQDPRVHATYLGTSAPGEGERDQALAACDAEVLKEAVRFSERVDQLPRLVAVWDGQPGAAADAVDAWTRQDLPVDILTIPGHEEAPATPAAKATTTPPAPGPAMAPPGSKATTRDIGGYDGEHDTTGPDDGTLHYDNRYLLAIGIDQAGGWPALENAQRDAEAIARALQDDYRFDAALCTGAEATRDGIADAVAALEQRANPDDLVVIYFAGHGHSEEAAGQDHGYIVPADAAGASHTRLISIDNLTHWSARLRCRHLLFLFDSCFSGMLIRLTGHDRLAPNPDYARLAITSGRQDQTVFDGPHGGHSPFADALLEVLRQGLPEGRDAITASELFPFLRRRVTERHPTQSPLMAHLKNHEGGEVVLQRHG